MGIRLDGNVMHYKL